MTLRPRICATSNQTNNEKKTETGQVPDAHLHLAKNDCLSKTVPGVILLSISSLQDQCHVQQIQDRHSWFTRGRSAGAAAPTILSSRPSATSEAITRSDSAAVESAGRYMMRLVTSCITGRRPQTPAGATLQRAFNGVHADGQSTSRRWYQSEVARQSHPAYLPILQALLCRWAGAQHRECLQQRVPRIVEHAVDGSSFDGTGIWISLFFCFLHLVIASIMTLHPSDPVPRLSNLCQHTTQRAPHPPSCDIRIRALSSESVATPYFSTYGCGSFPAVDPLLTAAPRTRTTRSSLRRTFHHRARFCALPDNCAVVFTTVSCVLLAFQWAAGYINHSSQHLVLDCAQVSAL